MGNKETKEYDVLIIGSGASGGMAAYTLTQKGAKCLLLDAGAAVDFNRQRGLKPVYELPYRGFGKPGRLSLVYRCFSMDRGHVACLHSINPGSRRYSCYGR